MSSRRLWKRRIVVVAIVLGVAAIVQWHREISLAVLGRWHHWKTGAEGVDVETGRSMSEQGVLLIDVREPGEFAVSHLAGAINIPLDALLEKGLPKDAEVDGRVVLYCTIGRRSGLAAKRLTDGGVSAYNVVGGILQVAEDAPDWIESIDGDRVVHVWGDTYAWLAPPGFRAVTFSGGRD